METYEQITLDQWVQWKEDIRQKLAETAGNFVHIGYRLKQIRDSGMFDGAADIFGFAEREYGLGKSTVSRFIAINERYSEGGNSLELKEEFRAFSSSKLSEMLTLPDNEIQLITEKTTIREIRELKEFNRQDVPPETAGEETRTDREAEEHTPFEKCLIDYFKDKEGTLNSIMGYLEKDPPGYRDAMERMNPSGQASHKKGIVFLFLYDWATGIKYKLLTQPEPVSMAWTDFLDVIYHIYGACDAANVWQDFYGEAAEKKEGNAPVENAAPPQPDQGPGAPVATSQQEDRPEVQGEEPGTDNRPEGMTEKVPEAREETPAAVMEEEPPAAAIKELEEQLPGQMEVYDYPEMIPEGMKEESNGTGETEAGGSPSATDEKVESVAGTDGGGQEPGDIPEPDAVPGTTEDGGCTGDTEQEDDLWMKARRAEEKLRQYLTVWDGQDIPRDLLHSAYRTAIDLAAAIEGILIRRGKNE